MMKKILSTLAMLLCLTSCIADSTDDSGDTFLPAGSPAPDITIFTDDYPDGLAISELRGRYVMIEFWASWCPDCRKVTDEMKEMHAAFASNDLIFIGLSFDTSEDTFRAYIEENAIDWLQYSEFVAWKESTISTAFNIKWIPAFYLIDPDGNVAFATIEISEMREKLQEISNNN